MQLTGIRVLSFGTRPSALARRQTAWVMLELEKAWPELECREEVITTQGDRILDRPLPEIGGKGLFTQELEAELFSGRIQAAVHSLKDLPVENSPGLVIGAIPQRAEARDALISASGRTLEQLPEGAVIGTSSQRRSAQLLAFRPDLRIKSLRGNVDTRLRKALEGHYDAIVLAGAGLVRLGLDAYVTQWLPLDIMLPAPGQGALAVQCREEDGESLSRLLAVENETARKTTLAERAFLAGLGGGCSLPAAAFARMEGQEIELHALVASLDGKKVIRSHLAGHDPLQLGSEVAEMVLSQGAGALLNE